MVLGGDRSFTSTIGPRCRTPRRHGRRSWPGLHLLLVAEPGSAAGPGLDDDLWPWWTAPRRLRAPPTRFLLSLISLGLRSASFRHDRPLSLLRRVGGRRSGPLWASRQPRNTVTLAGGGGSTRGRKPVRCSRPSSDVGVRTGQARRPSVYRCAFPTGAVPMTLVRAMMPFGSCATVPRHRKVEKHPGNKESRCREPSRHRCSLPSQRWPDERFSRTVVLGVDNRSPWSNTRRPCASLYGKRASETLLFTWCTAARRDTSFLPPAWSAIIRRPSVAEAVRPCCSPAERISRNQVEVVLIGSAASGVEALFRSFRCRHLYSFSRVADTVLQAGSWVGLDQWTVAATPPARGDRPRPAAGGAGSGVVGLEDTAGPRSPCTPQ